MQEDKAVIQKLVASIGYADAHTDWRTHKYMYAQRRWRWLLLLRATHSCSSIYTFMSCQQRRLWGRYLFWLMERGTAVQLGRAGAAPGPPAFPHRALRGEAAAWRTGKGHTLILCRLKQIHILPTLIIIKPLFKHGSVCPSCITQNNRVYTAAKTVQQARETRHTLLQTIQKGPNSSRTHGWHMTVFRCS